MRFELAFLEEALAEWLRLDGAIRTQLKKIGRKPANAKPH